MGKFYQNTGSSNINIIDSIFPQGMISLRSPVAREWVAVQRDSIRSWGDFVDQTKFGKPNSPQEITARVKKNLAYFQSNYLVIVAVLAAYCIITSPLLLLAIGAFFWRSACYYWKSRYCYTDKSFWQRTESSSSDYCRRMCERTTVYTCRSY